MISCFFHKILKLNKDASICISAEKRKDLLSKFLNFLHILETFQMLDVCLLSLQIELGRPEDL